MYSRDREIDREREVERKRERGCYERRQHISIGNSVAWCTLNCCSIEGLRLFNDVVYLGLVYVSVAVYFFVEDTLTGC